MFNHYLKIKFVLLCFFLLQECSGQKELTTQTKEWPVSLSDYRNELHYNAAPNINGYILTVNNDTLKGLIKLYVNQWVADTTSHNRYQYYISVLPTGKHGKADVIDIDTKRINYIRLYPDTTGNFLDFVNLCHTTITGLEVKPYDICLWRALGRKKDVGIYDNYQFMGSANAYRGRMLLLAGNKATEIYSSSEYKLQGSNRDKLLLKFINKRYNTTFHKTDFTTTKAMIDYIVNRENVQS